MKLRFAWLALALVGTARSQQPPVAPPQPQRPAGPVEVGGIAATVNGLVITKSEVGFMLAPMYGQLAAQFPHRGAEFERQVLEVRDKVLDALIDQKIMLSEFSTMAKNGAKLPDHVIDDEIRREIKEEHNGNEAQFREELKKANIREDKFRAMTRDRLIVQAIRSEHFSDAPPPLPGEIAKEYAEVKDQIRDFSKDKITFQKIFLPRVDAENPGSSPESQLDLADKLVTDIRNGKDIGELAKTNSRDSYATEGGLQKDLPRPDLAPEFASIIFAGKDGELLGPLEDPQGFTIVKIIHIEKGPSPPLSEVKEQIENMVRKKKSSIGYEKWIAEKRKTAMISKKL
jgi:parvulin-like peptidyl-prolyl isomerase